MLDEEREQQIFWFESLKEMLDAKDYESVGKAIDAAIKVLRRNADAQQDPA